MNAWEYRFYRTRRDELEKAVADLHDAGAEGWEVVSAFPEYVGDYYLFVLKRPCAPPWPVVTSGKCECLTTA